MKGAELKAARAEVSRLSPVEVEQLRVARKRAAGKAKREQRRARTATKSKRANR